MGLHVRRWDGGPGRPVLLVHGLASNARLWDGVALELAAAGHPVAAVDLPGHGRSDAPDDGYDVPAVAGDLATLIEALGWERPVVAGQSWGGNVVVELAARWPDAVGAVAGIDGGTIDLQRRFPRWEDCAEALAPPRLAGTPLADIEARLRRMHPDWPETGIQGQLACFRVHEDGTVSPWLTRDRHLRVLRGLWEHRPDAAYPRIVAPVLLVGAVAEGTNGRDGGPSAGLADAARALARARIERMRGDHDLHAQHPEAVAGLLAELAAEADR
ncbi:MAG: alpha/beta fold hydrolase [Acidimicrobiia bacterium]